MNDPLRLKACLILLITAALRNAGCVRQEPGEPPSPISMNQPKHPGTILFINDGDGSRRSRPVHDVPENKRFVYLAKGVETHAPDKADEAIPIVEVRLTPVDGTGKVVPASLAKKIRVNEFGPAQRLLRSTTMLKN